MTRLPVLRSLYAFLPLTAAGVALAATPPIDPNPTVVAGEVSFAGLETPHAVITQGTGQAIVDYGFFNVLPGGSVEFLQPGADAAILNRILGAAPSLIEGSVTANGQVYFVNPAGVTFGPDSLVRADTFLAAAGQLSNEDFLAGNLALELTGNLVNEGTIETTGAASLLGRQVFNGGEIVSREGIAVLASGDRIYLQPVGRSLLVEVASDGAAPQDGTAVDNAGSVTGEEVLFAAGDAYAMAVRHRGAASAASSAKLYSDGGAIEVGGSVAVPGGRIEVGGTDRGGAGVPRASATTLAAGSLLDASSASGDGGHIVVWADALTTVRGTVRATGADGAEGGFLEISAAELDLGEGLWDISLGAGGELLFDPLDVVIDATDANNIASQMNAGTSVTVDTDAAPFGGAGAEPGDITVAAPIQVTNTANQASLTLNAARDIILNEDVTSLQPVAGGTVFSFNAGRNITVSSLLQSALTSSSAIALNAPDGVILVSGSGGLVGTGSIDSGGSSVLLDGGFGITLQTGSQVLGGINTSTDNLVSLQSANGTVTFDGGLIQTFGQTDVSVVAQRLVNATGSNAITSVGGAGFWEIVLPHPFGGTASTNAHAYGGLLSNNPAVYDSSGTGDPVRNEYHYTFQPVIDVTANEASKLYGDAPLATYAGVTIDSSDLINAAAFGGVFTQDTLGSSVAGTVSYSSPGAPTTAPVADYAITPSGLTSPNGYGFNYIDGTLTVDPRPVTLTATQQEKLYGDPLTLDDTAFTVLDTDGDALLPNGETIDTVALTSQTGVAASTTADAALYTDEIAITGQTGSSGFVASNYAFTYVEGDLLVNPRPITVVATTQEKFFGNIDTLDTTAFAVTDVDADNVLPNGETIDAVALTSVTGKDASTIAAAATYADELQPTGVTGSNGFEVGNYDITFETGDYVIAPRPITLTATTQTKVYGNAYALDDTAFTVADLDADDALPNGETIEAVSLSSQTGIAASTTADAGTYADELAITGQSGADGFSAANYAITYVEGDLVVDPRPITLAASQQGKDYGDPLTLDATAFTVLDTDGDAILPNGELIETATLTSTTGAAASTTADAGTYVDEILPIGQTGSNGFDAANYDVTYTAGDLVVAPRAVTLTASQQTKDYGDPLALDETAFAVTDKDGDATLPNGETIETASMESATGIAASTTANAGTYTDEISITGQTGSGGFDAANYAFSYEEGDLVVEPRPVTLTASPQSKDYGDPLSLGTTAFTLTDKDGDSSLPNGERVNSVTLVSNTGIAASTTADAGTYVDEISITDQAGSDGFSADNYSLIYTDGDLVVAPRPVTMIANDQTKIYGNVYEVDPEAFTLIDKDGDDELPNGEFFFGFDLDSATGVARSTTADVGTYVDEMQPTGVSAPVSVNLDNYEISLVDGDLIVVPRTLTLTALEQSKIYGNVLTLDGTAFSLSDLDGDTTLPNGETVDRVTLESATGVAASTTAGADTYVDEIVITGQTGAGGFEADNYDFIYVAGDLTVARRPITLAASDQSLVYGDALTSPSTLFTVTDVDGDAVLPNGETVASVSLVSGAGEASGLDIGSYADALTITGQTGGNDFDAANYTFTYEAGDLAVTPRPITLTADEQGRLFFQEEPLDPTAFTVTDADGDSTLPNGEQINAVTLVSANGVASDLEALPGTYTDNLSITGQSGGSGFAPSNYTITYRPGDYVISGSAAPAVVLGEAFAEAQNETLGLAVRDRLLFELSAQPAVTLLSLFGDPVWEGLSPSQRARVVGAYDRTPPDQVTAAYLQTLLREATVQ